MSDMQTFTINLLSRQNFAHCRVNHLQLDNLQNVVQTKC